VDETQKCKEIRREIVKILSPEIYNTWFTHVKLVEVGSDVFMEADNAFIHDHIRWVFQDKIGLKFIEEAVDHQDIEQQKKIPEIIEATTNCVDLEEMKKHEKPEQKKSKNFISEFFCSKLKLSPEEIATQHINALPESETCKEIRRKIVKIISAEHYNLWFKYIELVENDGSVLMQEVNGVGGFAQKYISENFSPKIGLEFAGGDKRSLNNMAIAA
jgi:chromosomal replication initiation ATPase DnaA